MHIKEASIFLNSLDKIDDFKLPRVGRWLVWPNIKHALLDKLTVPEGASIQQYKRFPNMKSIASLPPAMVIGLAQVIRHRALRRKLHYLVFLQSNCRREKLPDGSYRDIYLDDLLLSGKLNHPTFVNEGSDSWGYVSHSMGPRHVYEDPIKALLHLKKYFLKKSTPVKQAAQKIIVLLKSSKIPLQDSDLEHVVFDVIAHFEAQRQVYRQYIKNTGAQAVLVVDALSFPGKIAATRELGIPIFDFQHGFIGRSHPSYFFPESWLKYKPNIPCPDKLLVWGQLWKKMLLDGGFWKSEEISIVGSADMDKFRPKRSHATKNTVNKLSLLFTSQWTYREEAIYFWKQFLTTPLPFDYELIIKLHPSESGYQNKYKELLNLSSAQCKIIFDEKNTLSLILRSDISISYNSTTLVESLSLGTPAISICSSTNPGGLTNASLMPEFKDSIKHVKSLKELITLIASYANDRNFREQWWIETREAGENIFKTGFVENAAREINQHVKQGD